MGLFKVLGGVVKGIATVVGGVAKGTALIAERVVKGTVVVAEGISDALGEDEKKEGTNNSTTTDCFVIEEGTTSVEAENFESYNGERTIVLPSTLEKISYDAFEECQKVGKIDFFKVSKLKTIPSGLFDGLHHLSEIIIPKGVIEIEPDAIIDCKRLCKVVLPSTLREMGSQFSGCETLREIDTTKVCRH